MFSRDGRRPSGIVTRILRDKAPVDRFSGKVQRKRILIDALSNAEVDILQKPSTSARSHPTEQSGFFADFL
jgi:hypothetical protein